MNITMDESIVGNQTSFASVNVLKMDIMDHYYLSYYLPSFVLCWVFGALLHKAYQGSNFDYIKQISWLSLMSNWGMMQYIFSYRQASDGDSAEYWLAA